MPVPLQSVAFFFQISNSYLTKNRTLILEGVWGTQPSPNRGFGGESPNLWLFQQITNKCFNLQS